MVTVTLKNLSRAASVVFVIPAGRSARTIAFNDGASTDEYYF